MKENQNIVTANISKILYCDNDMILMDIIAVSPERQQGPVLSNQGPSYQGSLCPLTHPAKERETVVAVVTLVR